MSCCAIITVSQERTARCFAQIHISNKNDARNSTGGLPLTRWQYIYQKASYRSTSSIKLTPLLNESKDCMCVEDPERIRLHQPHRAISQQFILEGWLFLSFSLQTGSHKPRGLLKPLNKITMLTTYDTPLISTLPTETRQQVHF